MTWLTILVAILALIVCFFVGYYKCKNDLASQLESLKYYKKTYLHRIGGTTQYPSYHLVSIDGGLKWYAMEKDSDGSTIILGLSEEIFPGLIEHLKGMDRLTEYVLKNGPIEHIGPEEAKILGDAGFTVKGESD